MSNEEIRFECEKQYDIIKKAKERLKEIQSLCRHDDTKEVLFSYYGDPSRARKTTVCSSCGLPLKKENCEIISPKQLPESKQVDNK